MFLRQLSYLIAIAEEQHFARAAKHCNVTQASLSYAIKRFELELGVPMFLRQRGRRFRGLTPEGERVAGRSRAVLAYIGALRKEVALSRNQVSGNLRIAAMPTLSPVLPFLVAGVRAKYPELRIDIRFIGHEAIKTGLQRFSFDVALAYVSKTDLTKNTFCIYADRLSLLVPDKPQFRDRSTITWREAAQLPLAMLRPAMDERRFVDDVFKRVGCSPVPLVESESIMHLMFQARFADVCTIVPSYYINVPGLYSGTRALKLIDPIVTNKVGLIWRESDTEFPMTAFPMTNAFLSVVQKIKKSGDLEKHLQGIDAGLSMQATMSQVTNHRDSKLVVQN